MSFIRAFSGSRLYPSLRSADCTELSQEEQEELIRFIASNMRDEDRTEMLRLTGNDAEWEIRSSVNMSDIVLMGYSDDGTPLSIFGARRHNLMCGETQLWSLSTKQCNGHWVEFARNCRRCLDLLISLFPESDTFTNYIDMGYTKAVRWVKWMGAEIHEDDSFTTMYGGRFCKFVFKRKDP